MSKSDVADRGKEEDEGMTITREFNAPRQMVWRAWTEPDLYTKWWGPAGFTSPACKIDLRVGGKYLCCMRSPDGKDYWTTGTYREIAPPSLLIMTSSFADERGNIVPASYYDMSADIALETVVTVRLQEIDDKKRTKLILTHAGIAKMSALERSSMEQGWNESLDKMEAALGGHPVPAPAKASVSRTIFIAEPGKQDVTVTREFNAKRDLVFKAFTDPSLYPKWIGPRGYATKLEKFEPKSGGSWRYTQKDPSGNTFSFHGVYHEVLAPERMIDTFEFEGLPEKGHVSLETAKFDELPGGRTRLTIHAVYMSVADRDGMVGSGMEWGLNESLERLTELLADMQK
jgi:uncharacterized protein YndB with AHSA1/START domain